MNANVASFPGPALLNEAQAAQSLNVTISALRSWRLRGGGPVFVKAGRLVRYRPVDLEAWIKNRCFASTSEAGGAA
jgi:hypothetical protein